MNDDLKRRQRASQLVETRMMEFLLEFSSFNQLTIADAKHVAAVARNLSFDAFEETLTETE